MNNNFCYFKIDIKLILLGDKFENVGATKILFKIDDENDYEYAVSLNSYCHYYMNSFAKMGQNIGDYLYYDFPKTIYI